MDVLRDVRYAARSLAAHRTFSALAIVVLGLGLAVNTRAIRLMSATVVAIPSMDPVAFVGVSLLLAAVVLLACYIPARRGARIDPMVALREL